MSYTYNRNVPNGPNDPADDQVPMLSNAKSIQDLIKQDHIDFNVSDPLRLGGYHTVIHLANTTVPPVVSPGGFVGQLYNTSTNDGITSDEILFYLTGGNRLIQFTRNFKPIITTNGATFLPGGLIFQYGSIAPNPGGTVTVNFPLPFPTSVFSITATPRTTSSIGGGNHDWDVGSIGLSSFKIATNGNYLNTDTFFWMAIGI